MAMILIVLSAPLAFVAEVDTATINAQNFKMITLIPPIVAIVLALITKNVVVLLFLGILSGSLIINITGNNVFSALVEAFLDLVDR
jgi:hypothetical protein